MVKRSAASMGERSIGTVTNNTNHEDVLRHPSAKRARQIDLAPPLQELNEIMGSRRKSKEKPTRVLHWFRSDFRLEDNRALFHASQLAIDHSVPLITLYASCSDDFRWQGTSPARVDFIFQNLGILKSKLEKMNIPLCFVQSDSRKSLLGEVLKFIEENGISHVFANLEYEIDELRRDLKVLKDSKVEATFFHDQTIVRPGEVRGGSGPLKVFTPYHQTWLEILKRDSTLLKSVDPPKENPLSMKSELKALFDQKLPEIPNEKKFDNNEQLERIRKLWPAGHEAALKRLNAFVDKKIDTYGKDRSNPSKNVASRMSPYFAAGVISMRETMNVVKSKRSSSAEGPFAWIRELCFREFYRQQLAVHPHKAMNLPHNLKFTSVEWQYNEDHWKVSLIFTFSPLCLGSCYWQKKSYADSSRHGWRERQGTRSLMQG